jgi:hypothetical protein
MRNTIYRYRSNLSHGTMLLQLDEAPWSFGSTFREEEYEASRRLDRITRDVMVNWLRKFGAIEGLASLLTSVQTEKERQPLSVRASLSASIRRFVCTACGLVGRRMSDSVGRTSAMKVAILRWGSLIRDAGKMTLDGEWALSGPKLLIEFSRISKRRHLTLVIDHEHGDLVTTYFVKSGRTAVADAREELRVREDTPSQGNIGYVDLASGSSHSRSDANKQTIVAWAKEKEFDAVIWTDLPPKFEMGGSSEFSVDRAVTYLQGLDEVAATKARNYIKEAPVETDTPLRRKLAEIGWI